MSPERWKQIEDIFQIALDLPPSERKDYLLEKCGAEPSLLSEVEKLLSQFEEASSFIESPAYSDPKPEDLSKLMALDDEDPMIGAMLGSYQIAREIGRGGMGTVYEAIRADGEFRRKVAVKVVKRGMDTDFILRRFRNERQILATLEHPYITRLLDGGTTDDGRPYFVMDYIEGLPLYHYSDDQCLPIRERLKLFIGVCEAVGYAHQSLVIHRDLKPSNILVAREGIPRLLDFGIAKLLDPEMASDTLQPTATAMRMMTIDYASPEQVRGEQVTFSTDIYSLGVILYELLTGHRPYNFRSRLIEHAAQVITEQVPERPSLVVKTKENVLPGKGNKADETPTLIMIGRNRHSTLEEISRELEGSLDRIILYALNKTPEGRYGSVDAFCEDIRRHLAGKEVSAPALLPSKKESAWKPASSIADNSIAVLPFKLLSTAAGDDSAENYLSVGLADSLITRLSQLGSLIVRPTSSVITYSAQHTDPFEAGAKLRVRYILDGTIRLFGEKLRISLQLLDTTKESAIWAQQIDSGTNDLMALEDTISEKVAESILPQITGGERSRLARRGTESAAAYEAYQRGRFHWNQFTSDSLPKAIEFFQRSAELDPNFALAHVGIADFYIWASIYGIIPTPEASLQARFSIDRALDIDSQLGEAYATLGLLKQNGFEWEEAFGLYPKAIGLSPSYPNAHEWYSAILVGSGQKEEGLVEIRRAAELDPLSLRTKTLVAWTYYQAGEFSEALGLAQQIIDLENNYPQGHLQKGYVLIELGRGEESLEEIKKGAELMPGNDLSSYYLAFAYAAAGKPGKAREILAEMKRASAERHVKPMFLALAATASGELDEAFQYFTQAVEDRDPWMLWFGTEAKLEPIRKDPRYLELLRKTKNPIIAKMERDLRAKAIRSVAVLPFALKGEKNAEDKYLSIGLADAVIMRLSGLNRIAVRPTTSILKYDGNSLDPFAAGEEMKADFILNGSIERSGGKFRISTRLIEVSTRNERWANKFEENTHEILDVEDKVSAAVALSLIPELSGEEKTKLARRGTNNPEAYQAYMRGRTHWLNSTPEELAKALLSYSESISLDPNFAAPYAGIADYHNFLSVFGMMAPKESFPSAKENAEKALALDPKLAEAYVSLAIAAYDYDWDFERSERLFKRALELSPNLAAAHTWYAYFLSMMGRNEEALSHIGRAGELAPATYSIVVLHGFLLRNARRFEESREKVIRAQELMPGHFLAMLSHSWNVFALENFEEAELFCRKSLEVSGGMNMALYALAVSLAAAGKLKEARELTNELISRRENQYVSACYIALSFTALGEIDDAFEWLEAAFEEHDCWLPLLAVDPRFGSLRNDPRYHGLLKRIGHPLANSPEVQKNVSADQGLEKVSLAILPLSLLGGERENDAHLSVGLADVMITRLSQVKRIAVRPTSAILRYTKPDDPLKAGKDLSVDYVLSGTIRPAGKRIRISAQLLEIKTNSTIWSDKFDEDFAEVLELEDLVSEKVAKLLIPKLTAEEEQRLAKRKTNSLQAFESYIKGRHHLYLFTPEDFEKALFFLKEAIEIDPSYSLPHAALSDCYFALTGFSSKAPGECFPMMESMANRAVELDESLGNAYSNLGMIAFYNLDHDEGERLLKKGIDLNPNQQNGFIFYSVFLNMLGRNGEAREMAKRAMEFDPTSIFHRMHHIWVLYHSRRFDEALKEIGLSELANSGPPHALGVASWLYRHLGKHSEAIALGERSAMLSPQTTWFLSNLGACYAKSGNRDKALSILGGLEEKEKSEYLSSYCLAQLHLYLGDQSKAIELLERSVEEKDVWFPWIASDPELDPIRSQPRFQKLVEKIQGAGPAEPLTSTFRTGATSETPEQDTAKETAGKETPQKPRSGFYYRHRYKWAAAGVFSLLAFVAYLTGVLTVRFGEDSASIETDKADVSKPEDALRPQAPVTTPNSIVILPFKIEDAASNDLGVGLADALTSKLGAVKRLTVISGNTGRAIANEESQKIAVDLGVQYVLKCNIVKTDKNFKILSELHDSQNSSKRWKAELETKPEELFKVINVLGARILESMGIEPLPVEKQQLEKTHTTNGFAYELYLMGRSRMVNRSPENIRKAIATFTKAAEEDPGFALAYTGLSDAYNMQSLYEIPAPPDSYPNAISNAKKALSIDPGLAEAHVSLAYTTFFYLRDRTGAELGYRRAIQLNPSYAQAHNWFSSFLTATNRFPEAISEGKTAIQLDPRSLTARNGLAVTYFYEKQFDMAIEEATSILAINPDFMPSVKLLRWAYSAQGNHQRARETYMKERLVNSEGTDDEWYMIEAQVEALSGNKAQVLEKLNSSVEVRSVKENPNAYAYEIALAYNALGEKEKAFEWLEKAEAAKAYGFNFLEIDHRFENLRDNPRFQKLLQKLTGAGN